MPECGFPPDSAGIRWPSIAVVQTTIATLGTPQDITLQELRIECFFPADDATAKVFADWAASA